MKTKLLLLLLLVSDVCVQAGAQLSLASRIPLGDGVGLSWHMFAMAVADGHAYQIVTHIHRERINSPTRSERQTFYLRTYDVSNPAKPSKLGEIVLEEAEWPLPLSSDMAISDGHVYWCGESGVVGYSLKDRTRPKFVNIVKAVAFPPSEGSRIKSENAKASGWDIPMRLAAENGRLFVAYAKGDFYVYGMTNPSQPTLLGQIDYRRPIASISVSSNIAYIAAGRGGFSAYDLADLRKPELLGWIEHKYGDPEFNCIAVGNGVMFVSDGAGDMSVYDVGDPKHPKRTNMGLRAKISRHVAFSGRYAFATGFPSGLQVFDTSVPTNILRVVSVTDERQIFMSLAVSEGAIFTGSSIFGMSIYQFKPLVSPLPGTSLGKP